MAKPPHPFTFRDYRCYWLARFSNTIASTALVVVIGWQVYDIARRTMEPRDAAFQLGLVGLVQFVPLAVLTPIVGWTADRIDRRWIARLCILAEAACAALLALLAWHHAIALPALFGGGSGAGRRARLRRAGAPGAGAQSRAARGAADGDRGGVPSRGRAPRSAAPALGGYLYALAPWLPYAVSAGLFLTGFGGMMLIRPVARTIIGAAHPIRQMIDGLHYVRRNRMVMGAISLDLFAVLLGGATAMLPVYARDILHVGASGLGNLRAAPAAGSAVTAVLLGFRPLKTNVGVKMLASVCVFGAATIVFGLSTWMPLSLASLVVLGSSDMISVYVRQSLMQLYTPNEMRGRVGAVSSLFVSGSNELGEAESGLAATLLGPVVAVVAGGIGAIGVTLLWWRIFPELRRARTFDPPKDFESREAQA